GVPCRSARSTRSQPATSRCPRSLIVVPSGYAWLSAVVAILTAHYGIHATPTSERVRHVRRNRLPALAFAERGAGARGDRVPRRGLSEGEPRGLRAGRAGARVRGAHIRQPRPRRDGGNLGSGRDRRPAAPRAVRRRTPRGGREPGRGPRI